jgi:hypothetical protein
MVIWASRFIRGKQSTEEDSECQPVARLVSPDGIVRTRTLQTDLDVACGSGANDRVASDDVRCSEGSSETCGRQGVIVAAVGESQKAECSGPDCPLDLPARA